MCVCMCVCVCVFVCVCVCVCVCVQHEAWLQNRGSVCVVPSGWKHTEHRGQDGAGQIIKKPHHVLHHDPGDLVHHLPGEGWY